LLADLIRGKSVERAKTDLTFAIKKGAQPLLKLLNSAAASAKEQGREQEGLYISRITIDEGPKLKRWRARARGRAARIQKKTSHITLVLSEQEKLKVKKQPARIGHAKAVAGGKAKVQVKSKK
jgi:large subunit ribosomal protein L22